MHTLGIVKQPGNYHFLVVGEVVYVLDVLKDKGDVLVQRISEPLKQLLSKEDLILC